MMNRTNRTRRRSKRIDRVLGIVIASFMLAPSTIAQWEFVPDVSIDASGVLITPRDVVQDSGSGAFTTAPVGTIPDDSAIAAYHPEGGGDFLYAVRAAIELPGAILARRQDVVRVSAGTHSILFDGSSQGVPEGIGIDALSTNAAGDLLLSLDTSLELTAGVFAEDRDLVRWDGAAFSLFFDASAEGVPAGVGLDAAHYAEGADELLLSFATSGAIGGVVFDDEDLLGFDRSSGSWRLAFDGSARESALASADLVAVPEPGLPLVLALLGTGLIGVASRGRSKD